VFWFDIICVVVDVNANLNDVVCGWQVACTEDSYIAADLGGCPTLIPVSTITARQRCWPGPAPSASLPAIILSSYPITAVHTAQVRRDRSQITTLVLLLLLLFFILSAAVKELLKLVYINQSCCKNKRTRCYDPRAFPRDAMHKRGLCRRAASVRPSVCLSVTFVYCVEMSKHIVKIFHH